MKQKIAQSGGALVGRQTLAIKAGSNNTKQKKRIQKQFNNNLLLKCYLCCKHLVVPAVKGLQTAGTFT